MNFNYNVFQIARAEHELRIRHTATEQHGLQILAEARNRRLTEVRSNVQRYVGKTFSDVIARLRQATSLRPA